MIDIELSSKSNYQTIKMHPGVTKFEKKIKFSKNLSANQQVYKSFLEKKSNLNYDMGLKLR